MKRAFFASPFVALAIACGSRAAPSGLDEPVRVRGAQFVLGPLPGTPPGVKGPPDLQVTSINTNSRIALPGQAGKKMDGRASRRAIAIGVRFADVGTGYWVLPVGPADPQFPGETSWQADLDFNLLASDAPGLHPLRVAAIDSAGAAGEQGEVSYCIASRAPDNLSACDPKIAPPDAVVSIYWDADVDVDLRAVLPGGRTVDPKNPSGDPSADGGAALAEAAYVTRDSLAGCVRDGRRQEDLVFPKRPSGSVDVYAHLADACGRPGASFTAVVYEAEGAVPARRLVERTRTAGRLVMAGGAESLQPPLFVLSYDFPPASKP